MRARIPRTKKGAASCSPLPTSPQLPNQVNAIIIPKKMPSANAEAPGRDPGKCEPFLPSTHLYLYQVWISFHENLYEHSPPSPKLSLC